jgi:secreted PhoX family phosphatase
MRLSSFVSVAACAAFVAGVAATPSAEAGGRHKQKKGQIALEEVKYPETEAEGRAVLSSKKALVNWRLAPTGFTTLLRSGTELPLLLDGHKVSKTETAIWGGLVMSDGTPLYNEEYAAPAYSNSNDFNSFIEVGKHVYLVSQFETRPAAIYQTLLRQEKDGHFTPVATRPIDFSKVKGGWVHCAGSVTPWGTHFGSEEYEPDARSWVDDSLEISGYNAAMHGYFDAEGWTFNRYNDDGSLRNRGNPQGDPDKAKAILNPYDYGWPVEVKIRKNGKTRVTKHFAMGRHANEISYVMPDERTVYITDDGTNTLILMFVADRAGDLSSGTLYAAKWNQKPGNESLGGQADLDWINLGWAKARQIKRAIKKGVTFDDLFDYSSEPAGSCSYTEINSGHGSPYYECLQVKAGADETVVSRLEARRYAALKGATSEFRKVEGFTFDPKRQLAYIAISEINNGMLEASEDFAQHEGGNDHIQLEREDCGAVYGMDIGGWARDTDGRRIRSQYVARNMYGVVIGETVSGDDNNKCDIDGIANPDNIAYLPGYDSLIIGEDTGSGHRNDLIWEYDTTRETLTRIQTTPYGSETTSPYWYPNLGGHGYLMSVIQHPYGESDQDLSTGEDDERGYTGYFKFPPLTRGHWKGCEKHHQH